MADFLTHGGKAIVANRILGSGTEPKNIGWSKSSTAADAAHSALDSEVGIDLTATSGNRTAGTSSRVTVNQTNDTYQVTGTLTATGAGTVQQAGLFDQLAFPGGGLYVMSSFTGIALVAGDSIAFTFKHTIA